MLVSGVGDGVRDALGRCSRVLKQFVSRRRESRERFMVLAQTSNKVGATCLKLRLCLLVSSTFGSSRTCPQILTMILTLTTHTIEVPPVVYHIPVQLERRAARVKQTHRSACLYGLPTLDALSRSISTYTTRTCSASPHTVRRAIVVQPTVTPDAPSQRRCSTPPPHSYCSRPLPGPRRLQTQPSLTLLTRPPNTPCCHALPTRTSLPHTHARTVSPSPRPLVPS